MTKIKKIEVRSAAKLQAVLMGMIGLIIGFFLTIFSILLGGSESFVIGPWSIIVLPIMYTVIGLVTGALSAYLYNITAKLIGGIEVELEK